MQVNVFFPAPFYSRTAPGTGAPRHSWLHLRPCNGWGWLHTAVYPDVSPGSEFQSVCQGSWYTSAGDSINLQRFRRERWLAIRPSICPPWRVWLKSRRLSSSVATVPHQPPLLRLKSARRLRLTPARPDPFWHSYHAAHLSLIVAHHITSCTPSRGKQGLWMSSTLGPSAWVWAWTAIQQVLNQSGRAQAGVLALPTVYTTKTRRQAVPAF